MSEMCNLSIRILSHRESKPYNFVHSNSLSDFSSLLPVITGTRAILLLFIIDPISRASCELRPRISGSASGVQRSASHSSSQETTKEAEINFGRRARVWVEANEEQKNGINQQISRNKYTQFACVCSVNVSI